MKHVMVLSYDEIARTGDYLPQCEGCPHAVLIEGDNVENGVILFCKKFFDFPVKFLRVKYIPSKVEVSFTTKFWCEE